MYVISRLCVIRLGTVNDRSTQQVAGTRKWDIKGGVPLRVQCQLIEVSGSMINLNMKPKELRNVTFSKSFNL